MNISWSDVYKASENKEIKNVYDANEYTIKKAKLKYFEYGGVIYATETPNRFYATECKISVTIQDLNDKEHEKTLIVESNKEDGLEKIPQKEKI